MKDSYCEWQTHDTQHFDQCPHLKQFDHIRSLSDFIHGKRTAVLNRPVNAAGAASFAQTGRKATVTPTLKHAYSTSILRNLEGCLCIMTYQLSHMFLLCAIYLTLIVL